MRSKVFHFLICVLILLIGAMHWVQAGIHEIFILFSSDGIVSQNLVSTVYWFIVLDSIVLAGIVYARNFFAQDKVLKILFIVELFLAQLIFLDRSGIQQEAHSITPLTTIQLFLAGLFALWVGYRVVRRSDYSKSQGSFWFLFGLGMVFGAADEFFMIHEPLGAVVINIPILANLATVLKYPDDVIIIIYALLAIGFVTMYYKHIKETYPLKMWVYIVLGVLFQALAEFSEFANLLYTEEYLELFASFMYMLFALSVAMTIPNNTLPKKRKKGRKGKTK